MTKEQVTADNVVVIYVSHTFTSQNEQDDEIYHINLVDSGKAFVFRDGIATAGAVAAHRPGSASPDHLAFRNADSPEAGKDVLSSHRRNQ